MDPQEQNEALREIGALVLGKVQHPWTEITLKYDALVSLTTSRITVTREGGSTEYVETPRDVSELMFQLRDGMHRPDKGTWYSARYTITPSGSFNVDFDYDNPPTFPFEPDPRTYYQDLRHYPRHFEGSPAWLKDRIREAAVMMKREKAQEQSAAPSNGSA